MLRMQAVCIICLSTRAVPSQPKPSGVRYRLVTGDLQLFELPNVEVGDLVLFEIEPAHPEVGDPVALKLARLGACGEELVELAHPGLGDRHLLDLARLEVGDQRLLEPVPANRELVADGACSG
jgi:hypothetical protein